MKIHEFSLHLEPYLISLKQQGKSKHTIENYRRDLLLLFSLLPQHQHPISRADFILVFKTLSQRNHKSRTLSRRLSAWRQYADFLVQQQLLTTNPIYSIRTPKKEQRLPKAIEIESLSHTLNQTPENELEIRDLAMFELFYGSGLRLSELQSLNLTDIALNEGWVNVHGKGNKQRQIPLTQSSIQAIESYLNIRITKSNETALFTTRTGTRISTQQIQKRLAQWASKNSTQHISPHMLRHSYASHLLQSSHNIRAIQELLGHSNLSTTQIYTHLDFDHLAQVYDTMHPRAKRQK